MEDNEQKSELIKDNSNNFCARPTLALAKVAFLPTIKTNSSSLAKLSKKWFAPFASNLHNPTFKRA